MEISRSGLHRSTEDTELVREDVTQNKAPFFDNYWNKETGDVYCYATGAQYESTYQYTIQFSYEEILYLLALGVENCSSSQVEKAMGLSSIDQLKELLRPKSSGTSA